MMLDFIGLWIYLIGNFIVRIYWRGWKIYTKKKFISCGKNVYLGKNSVFTANHIEIGDDVYIGESKLYLCGVKNPYRKRSHVWSECYNPWRKSQN